MLPGMSDSRSDDKATPVQKHYDTIISQFDDISQDEKNDLVRQIENVISSESITATSRLFAFTPKHRGVLFPAVVNSTALILIALVVFISTLLYRIKYTEMSMETSTFLSTERRILDEFREESERQLQEKDKEIVTIQAEVEELDRQIEGLKQIMQSSIDNRENELSQAMQEALDSERARLGSQGFSEAEIKRKIAELEERMSSEYNRQLEAYRKESEASLKEREEALLEKKEEAAKRLEEASREKGQLLEETRRRETELQERYDSEKARLREKTSAAEERFKVMSELREKELLVTDQILGSYTAIIAKIENEDFAGAHKDLANLREMLLNESLDYMPTVVKRRKIELFMVELLEERVEAELFGTEGSASAEEQELESIREAASLVLKIRQIVKKADAASREGDVGDAERLYINAMEELQAVAAASRALETIKGRKHRTILQAHVDRAAKLSAQGDYNDAVAQYRRGALSVFGDNQDVLITLLDGLTESLRTQQEHLREAGLAGLESGLEEARRQGREQGRKSALDDTLRLLASLTAPSSAEAKTYDAELEAKTESDPLLKSVFEKAQQLLEAEKMQETIASGNLRLIGVLATVSSNEAIIEPLVQIEVNENTLLWIKRRSRSGKVISIAQAVVRQVSARRITARIEKIFVEGQEPRVTDLAYIER